MSKFYLTMINYDSCTGRIVFTELTKDFTQSNVLDRNDEARDVDNVGIITLLVTSKPYVPSRGQL